MAGTATINGLHAFSGHPAEFWPEFCAFACKQVESDSCTLIVKQGPKWKVRYRWPAELPPDFSEPISTLIDQLADEAMVKGVAVSDTSKTNARTILALRLEEADDSPPGAAVFFLTDSNTNRTASMAKLQLLGDAPAVYHRFRKLKQAEKDLADIVDILDLQLILNSVPKSLAATMTLVNEIAARFRCSRVSLGWNENGYVRVKAISQMERFDDKMEVVSSLEAAMEEAFDQDEEILFPTEQQDGPVARDHGEYSRQYNVVNLLSLPLRSGKQPVGVLTCERQGSSFKQEDVDKLRILCDLAASQLKNIRERDRGMITQLKDGLRERLSGLVGVEHTFTKFLVVATFCLIVASAIINIPYRIEAPFILRSEDVRQVSTPFEGYIDDVSVRIGQLVKKGDQLLTLDSSDLRLQESAAVANQVRFLREVEKARASGSLVDMKIAQAQADQASAQLNLIRHRLSLAEIEAPIDGIVVEGDLEQLRGAPVEAGDILFKIARHELLFIEAKVNEEDIHELSLGQNGEFAFVSRPQLKYPFRVDLIDPVAIPEDKGNVFLVRGRDLKEHETWWRPGMSGIVKVNVGQRSILWIATHRTIDFFQMLMWW